MPMQPSYLASLFTGAALPFHARVMRVEVLTEGHLAVTMEAPPRRGLEHTGAVSTRIMRRIDWHGPPSHKGWLTLPEDETRAYLTRIDRADLTEETPGVPVWTEGTPGRRVFPDGSTAVQQCADARDGHGVWRVCAPDGQHLFSATHWDDVCDLLNLDTEDTD